MLAPKLRMVSGQSSRPTIHIATVGAYLAIGQSGRVLLIGNALTN